MKVHLVQPEIVWEKKAANFRRVRALLAAAAPGAGSLIVLPEMFATGFSMNLAATRQHPEREDERFLAALARDYRASVIGGVVGGEEDGVARNEAVAFSPACVELARYAKMHLFTLAGEDQVHQPGAEVVVFPCYAFNAALFICYDLRFPEAFRAAVHRGADLFIVIASWPAKRQSHWLTLLQARAVENQAYVIGVNRVGADPGYTYAGRSVVVDPQGTIMADAGEHEGVCTAELDAAVAAAWRRDFPALKDARRPLGPPNAASA